MGDYTSSYTGPQIDALLGDSEDVLDRILVTGASTDQGAANITNTLAWHIADADGDPATVIILSGTHTVKTNVTVPVTMELVFKQGGILADDASNADLTINGKIKAGPYKIFSWSNGTGTLTFGKNVEQSNVLWATGEPDGSTDNSAGFQDIVTASAGIKTIIPKTASSYVVEGISVPSNSYLIGYNEPVIILKNSATDHMFKNSDAAGGNTNIDIIGLELDGNVDNISSAVSPIYFDNVTGFNIRDCYMYDPKGSATVGGFYFKECSEGMIERNKVEGVAQAIAPEAIFCDGCTNITIERNHIKNFDLSGISTNAASAACSDIKIMSNFLDESSTGASAISFNSTDSIASHNIIKGVTQSLSRSGVVVGHTSHPADRSRVIGNVIDDCPIGVNVSNGTDVVVMGNYVEDAAIGIRVNSSDCHRAVVIGNNIVDCNDNATVGSPLDGYGIRVEGDDDGTDVENVVVSGNNIYDTESCGVYTQFTAGCIIKGNNIIDCGTAGTGAAVILEGANQTVMTDNVITDTRGTPAAQGIQIDHSEDSSDLIVAKNIITGPTAAFARTTGGTATDLVFVDNYIDKAVRSTYVHKSWYGSATPVSGELSAWAKGDIKRHSDASPGEPLFWVFTADGSSSTANWAGVGYVVGEAFTTFGAADTTPSVKHNHNFLTGGAVTITDFDDGIEGQIIHIVAEHIVTITDGTNIFLNSSGNFVMAATDTLTLICKADNKWYELSRSDNT